MVEPSLQEKVSYYLSTLPPGDNKDGAVVVLDPKTGAVVATSPDPTYDPNPLAGTSLSQEQLAYFGARHPEDHEGFIPLRPIATGERFFPARRRRW